MTSFVLTEADKQAAKTGYVGPILYPVVGRSQDRELLWGRRYRGREYL